MKSISRVSVLKENVFLFCQNRPKPTAGLIEKKVEELRVSMPSKAACAITAAILERK